MGFILMYDVTNEESFNAVQDWLVSLCLYLIYIYKELCTKEGYMPNNLLPLKFSFCTKFFVYVCHDEVLS